MKEDLKEEQIFMVNTQIKRRGIKDQKVLNAMMNVPREVFVSCGSKRQSYEDGPLSIGYGQTISQPYIVAYMTELLKLEGDEKVLEIGTGSGYQTAVLAKIVETVYSVELIPELSERAKHKLEEQLSYSNIQFKVGNGREGWDEHSPYDRIIVTAAPEIFPTQIFSQLKEGGIVVSPVGDYFQKMIRYKKIDDEIYQESLIGVSFVPLI